MAASPAPWGYGMAHGWNLTESIPQPPDSLVTGQEVNACWNFLLKRKLTNRDIIVETMG